MLIRKDCSWTQVPHQSIFLSAAVITLPQTLCLRLKFYNKGSNLWHGKLQHCHPIVLASSASEPGNTPEKAAENGPNICAQDEASGS